ncbi:hypothetical protein JCM5353_008251 [Sporobolomyces roseus]
MNGQGQKFGGPGAPPQAIEYTCADTHPLSFVLDGLDCAANNEIKAREPIRCRECGCRVMYKKRIKRSKQTLSTSRRGYEVANEPPESILLHLLTVVQFEAR